MADGQNENDLLSCFTSPRAGATQARPCAHGIRTSCAAEVERSSGEGFLPIRYPLSAIRHPLLSYSYLSTVDGFTRAARHACPPTAIQATRIVSARLAMNGAEVSAMRCVKTPR